MKKLFAFIVLSLLSIGCFAEQFSCDKIGETITRWNQIKQDQPSDVVWAKAIVDSTAYRVNEKGEIEYEYVIKSTDTLDLPKLKDITLDFLQYYFNFTSTIRANVVQGSTDKSIFFQGHFNKLAYLQVFLLLNYFNADIFFDFKFKEDRVKIKVTVPYLTYHIGDKYTSKYPLLSLDPFHHYKDFSKNDRDLHARAMINVLAKTMSYPAYYLTWLNEHYAPKSTDTEDDW
jgi:hypothetical protein